MTASALNGESITVEVAGVSVTVALEDATELITKLFAARKEGYLQRREAKAKDLAVKIKSQRRKLTQTQKRLATATATA
jgi:hypothetical protein